MREYHQVDPRRPKVREQSTMVDILSRSPQLSQIVYKVDQLAKLNHSILKKLDPDLSRYCRVANCRDGILILTTDNPSVGHLLRFSKMDLLSSLREDPAFCHLKAIQTRVRPTEPIREVQKTIGGTISKWGRSIRNTIGKIETDPRFLKLSPDNSKMIKELANRLESSTLKQALLKLGSRTR